MTVLLATVVAASVLWFVVLSSVIGIHPGQPGGDLTASPAQGTDIVERLRHSRLVFDPFKYTAPVELIDMRDAADEIERLRREKGK